MEDEIKPETKAPAEINKTTEKINKPIDLGERMKKYEEDSLSVIKIEPYRSFVIRLDGRSFSNYTSGLRKPFDSLFSKAMVLTTADLIQEFTVTTGYTHSDEITLIFSALCTNQEEYNKLPHKPTHIFDGRVIKLLTNLSGYCSARFNYHMFKLIQSDESAKKEYKSTFVDKVNEMKACFDARLVLFPEDKQFEVVNHQIWRSVFDCERNAVSTYARSHFTQKQLQSKNKKEMIKMLKEKGLDWEKDVEMFWKHGIYLKKVTYEIEVDKKKVVRSKICYKTFKIKYDDFFLNLLLCKYYEANQQQEKEYGILDYNF